MSTVTSSAFTQLPTDGTADGIYVISDGSSSPIDATDVAYDSSTNVKQKIDTKVSDNPTFTEASTRENIASGETFATILGKIKKWFTDLPNMFVSKSGDTMSGVLNVTPSSEEVIWCCKNHSNTASKLSEITVGNTKADGTEGASHGGLILFGKSNRYVLLQATNIASSNKTIELPNASGTIALTSDIPDIFVDTSMRILRIDSSAVSATSYIRNGKILLSSYRNPILCWHTDQGGYVRVFIIFSGASQDAWTLTVTNIVNAASVTAELNGNDIKLNNIGGWGNGIAIGLGI